MTFVRCTGASSGGSTQKNILWEFVGSYNNNFAGTYTVELNGDISDYDFIEFTTISNQNGEMKERTFIYSSAEVQSSVGTTVDELLAIYALGASYGNRYRTITYVSDTELTITYQNSAQATKYCIPSKITGVKNG